jgi:hypothetical protein
MQLVPTGYTSDLAEKVSFIANKQGDAEFTVCCSWPIFKLNLFNLSESVNIDSQDYLGFILSDRKGFAISTDSQVESERLEKAFEYLLSLCTKAIDPFDK